MAKIREKIYTEIENIENFLKGKKRIIFPCIIRNYKKNRIDESDQRTRKRAKFSTIFPIF